MSSEGAATGVFDEITSLSSLEAALERVVQAGGAPGPDGASIAEAGADRDGLVGELRGALLSGTYQPAPARRVVLAREDGRTRDVFVSNVRDRVVSNALAHALSGRLDDRLHDAAHAYRKGRSTRTALEAADALLGQAPSPWVLRLDIAQFFESVGVEAVLDCVRASVGEDEVLALLEQLLRAGSVGAGGYDAQERGLPTGSSLSPLLANLYLAPFDEALARAGKGLVRYGDDVLVVCEHEEQAALGEQVARAELSRLRLRLNEQKLRRCPLGEGFVFLGFEFDARGRRPSARAASALSRKVELLLARRPSDGREELRAQLRGWLQHYGSLEHVSLPQEARALATEVEDALVQGAQLRELERPQDEPAPRADRSSSRDAGYADATGQQSPREQSRAGRELHLPHEAFARKLTRAGIEAASQTAMLEALRCGDAGSVAERLASEGKHALAAEALRLGQDRAGRAQAPTGASSEKMAPSDPISPPKALDESPGALVQSPLASHPRALAVAQGCAVVRALVDKATAGRGLETSERYLLTDVLGRLGKDAEPSLEAVFRHLTDHRPGMAKRLLLRLYPMPTSCAKIRRNLAALASEVGCACTFRPPPGAYPTPVLHAVTTTEVPALDARVRQAPAPRGAVAKAALAAVNAGRVELGDRAAALCARMADLRRQIQVQQRAIVDLERRLGEILDEVGDGQLETPSGSLKRLTDADGRVRFVLEV